MYVFGCINLICIRLSSTHNLQPTVWALLQSYISGALKSIKYFLNRLLLADGLPYIRTYCRNNINSVHLKAIACSLGYWSFLSTQYRLNYIHHLPESNRLCHIHIIPTLKVKSSQDQKDESITDNTTQAASNVNNYQQVQSPFHYTKMVALQYMRI